MKYLIFDNEVYCELNGKTEILAKDKLNSLFSPGEEFSVALIDTLQKQVAAPEKSPDKKEEIIASSFAGDYLIQSEKISTNLFQVIAAEKSKVSEVYKYLGFEKVKSLVPYGVAVREFLKAKGVLSGNKTVVFLDHLGNQILLTIFNNETFTTPRRLSDQINRAVSELVRSQENYKALNKDKEEIIFLIATDSQEILKEVASTGLESKENILCFSEPYPALSGLKQNKCPVHYLLPEQLIRLRKAKMLKKRVFSLGIMVGVLGALFVVFLGSLGMYKNALTHLKNLELKVVSAQGALRRAYSAKYKDILGHTTKPDFAYFINSFIKTLPYGCKIESISIKKLSASYKFEVLIWQESSRRLDNVSLSALFKKAKLENILIKGNPGLRISLDIF